MSSAKHTSGPWRLSGAVIETDERPICEIYRELKSTDATIANAHLILAAPDMMEASSFSKAAMDTLEAYEADLGERLPDDHELGRIEDSRGSPSFRIRVGHIRNLYAAIAKAEGRT